MTNPHNLYNILAAFNAATRPVEVATPKQQAKMISERTKSTGAGRVAKQLNEALNRHKVSEGYSGVDDTDTVGFTLETEEAYNAVMEQFGDEIDHDETSGIMYVSSAVWPHIESVAFDADGVGAMRDDADRYAMDDDELGEAIDWNDMGSGGRSSNTTDTDTGRIHRAGPGGYGNQVDDNGPIALPSNQLARGRGRPKNLAGELKRKAAADRAIANQGVKQGRGRPRKVVDTGTQDTSTHGTLGLHNFLFGKMPDTLPGKPGVKHRISDKSTDDFDESMYENTRRTGTNRKLSESVDALNQIEQRFKHEVRNFHAGQEMDNDLYEALFDYYSSNGEMPYGVMKARTGDPYDWVAERFDQDTNSMGASLGSGSQFTEAQYTARSHDDQSLNELAKLAGITNESMSVIGGDYGMDQEDESRMNVSTNQSSDGKKNVTVTADGEAAVHLLAMLKMAGMGGSDAAQEQELIISNHSNDDDMCDEIEVEEDYSNKPASSYQSIDSMMSRGDDMNREKKQNFSLRAAGNNPMSESDPRRAMGRDLMAEYRAMKIRK